MSALYYLRIYTEEVEKPFKPVSRARIAAENSSPAYQSEALSVELICPLAFYFENRTKFRNSL
jgi:hypothetical protein